MSTYRGDRFIWCSNMRPSTGDSNSTYPGPASNNQMAWSQSAAATDFFLEAAAAAGYNVVIPLVQDEQGTVWDSAVWPQSPENPGPGTPGAETDPFAYLLDKAQSLGLQVIGYFLACGDKRHDGTGGLPDWLSGGLAPDYLDLSITACRDAIVARHEEFCTRYGAHPACRGLLLDKIRVGANQVGTARDDAIARVQDIVDRTRSATNAAGLELWTWCHHTESFYDQGNRSVFWLNAGTIDYVICGHYGVRGDDAHLYDDIAVAMGYAAESGDLEHVDADKRTRFLPSLSGSKDGVNGELLHFMTATDLRRVFIESQVLCPGHGHSLWHFARLDDDVLPEMENILTVPEGGPRALRCETLPVDSSLDDNLIYYRAVAGPRIDWDGSELEEIAAGTDPGMSGWRQVKNRINRAQFDSSEDLSTWTTTDVTLTETDGVYTATPTGGANSLIQRSNTVISNDEDPYPGAGRYRYRVRVRPSVNNQQIRLRFGNNTDGFVNQDITLPTANTWYWCASSAAQRSTGLPMTTFIYPDRSGGNNALDLVEPGVGGFAVYYVEREPSQMIPEYVYREDGHEDPFVDKGVQYFATQNGNSISDGIITDATGPALSASASHVGFGAVINAGVICALAEHAMGDSPGWHSYDIHPAFAHDDDKGGVVTLLAGRSADDDYFRLEMAQATGVITARAKLSGSPELTAVLDEIEFDAGDLLRITVIGLHVRVTNVDTGDVVKGRIKPGTTMRFRNAFPLAIGGDPCCANQVSFLLRAVSQQARIPRSTGPVDLY